MQAFPVEQRCQETGQARKMFSRQGCQANRSTLKPSSLASVEINYRKIAVGQGVKVPSPDIFAVE